MFCAGRALNKEKKLSTITQYKCPCCGGGIAFDPDLQTVSCPYCETEFDMDTLKGYDEDLSHSTGEDEISWNQSETVWEDADAAGMRLYNCTSCGAEIVADENTAATSCPYCGNPIVIKGRLSGDLKPDYIIPFKLDKKDAMSHFASHLTGKRLLPKVFRDQNHLEEIKGIYVPYWLFDGKAEGDVTFHGTKVRSWSDNDFVYTETSHYSVARSGSLHFENVPADGSSKMPDDLMESLEPYHFSDAVDFQTAYLAGFFADRYDVSAEQCEPRINERTKATTEQKLRETVNSYTSLQTESVRFRMSDSRILYVLFPVWLLITTWNGTRYTFAMNGQTGKFVGDLPVDKKLYWKWWARIFGITAAAVILIGLLIALI